MNRLPSSKKDKPATAVPSAIAIIPPPGPGGKVGLCGQASSDHPEFAAVLVECGIDSMSVSPDSFIAVKREVAEAESRGRKCRRG